MPPELIIAKLEVDGKFIIIEKVPVRVYVETGERYFAREVMEQFQ